MALLENGHDPNVKDTYGWTPLLWAANKGHEGIVKLLLATDTVDLDSRNNNGRTPLSGTRR
jgi:ankyrin repeat protein